jgi:hypothetical protein
MASSYLNRPMIPLAVALARMLEKIEAEVATVGPSEKSSLCRRAELIRKLLPPAGITYPGVTQSAVSCPDRAPPVSPA